jgi:sarcosine oxidase
MPSDSIATDVAVVGLGAMGSAALFHVARAGVKCIGIDAHAPPHSLGSTHGHSRIIREAYYEHPDYVPLVRRAYENWAELERLSQRTLFQRTGGLMIASPAAGLVAGTLESARQHDIAVSVLGAGEITARFPGLRPADDMIGVLEHNAGVLDPEACVQAHLDLARTAGAGVLREAPVSSIERRDGHIVLQTPNETIIASRVILCAGAWMSSLVRMLGVDLPLMVERQTMHWFIPNESPAAFRSDRFPIAMIEHEPGRYLYYIPDLGHGVKAAIHYEGAFIDPDRCTRDVTADDIRPVAALVRRFTPALSGPPASSAVCLYTNTPDKHFLIDTLAGDAQVFVVSACSGHGFKFASALGEAAAQACLGASPTVDISRFGAARLS